MSKYYDKEGKSITLTKLVRKEPLSAVSLINTLKEEISRLQEENTKLLKRVEIVSKGDFPNLDIEGAHKLLVQKVKEIVNLKAKEQVAKTNFVVCSDALAILREIVETDNITVEMLERAKIY